MRHYLRKISARDPSPRFGCHSGKHLSQPITPPPPHPAGDFSPKTGIYVHQVPTQKKVPKFVYISDELQHRGLGNLEVLVIQYICTIVANVAITMLGCKFSYFKENPVIHRDVVVLRDVD